jgi:hypothetical protein
MGSSRKNGKRILRRDRKLDPSLVVILEKYCDDDLKLRRAKELALEAMAWFVTEQRRMEMPSSRQNDVRRQLFNLVAGGKFGKLRAKIRGLTSAELRVLEEEANSACTDDFKKTAERLSDQDLAEYLRKRLNVVHLKPKKTPRGVRLTPAAETRGTKPNWEDHKIILVSRLLAPWKLTEGIGEDEDILKDKGFRSFAKAAFTSLGIKGADKAIQALQRELTDGPP